MRVATPTPKNTSSPVPSSSAANLRIIVVLPPRDDCGPWTAARYGHYETSPKYGWVTTSPTYAGAGPLASPLAGEVGRRSGRLRQPPHEWVERWASPGGSDVCAGQSMGHRPGACPRIGRQVMRVRAMVR